LESVDDSIGKLSLLQNLNLSHNQLKTLPNKICELRRLINLNLSHNQLNALPKLLGQIDDLEDLVNIKIEIVKFIFVIFKISFRICRTISLKICPIVSHGLRN